MGCLQAWYGESSTLFGELLSVGVVWDISRARLLQELLSEGVFESSIVVRASIGGVFSRA